MSRTESLTGIRQVLGSKRVIALFLTLVIVSSAGCSGFLGGDSGGDDSDAIASVPAGVDGVMQFDSGVIDDSTTVTLMDGLIDMGSDEVDQVEEQKSYEELIEEFEQETELSIDDFHTATVFMKLEDFEQEEYGGMIVETEWSWEELQEAADDTDQEFEEDSYNGVTVYKSTDEMGEVTWVADFEDGTFAFGTPEAVQDTIDTNQGDAETFSGELRDAYDRAEDGYMTAAFLIPEEEVNNAGAEAGMNAQFVPTPEIMTMTYYTDGNDMKLDTQMTMASQEEAEQFYQIAGGTIDPPSDGNQAQAGPMGSLIDATSVSQDGDTVTINFSMTPEEILTLLEEFNTMMGAGMGSGMSSVDGAQSIGLAG